MKTEKQSRRVLYSPIYFFMQPYYNCTCDSDQLKQNLSVFLFNKVKIKHWIFPYFSFIYVCFFVFFFSIRLFFHGHWQLTGQQGKWRNHLIPLYHFHMLTNIQTFICNFTREMNVSFSSTKIEIFSNKKINYSKKSWSTKILFSSKKTK